MNKTNYEIYKQRAREKAIEWQLENCDKCLCMSELAYYGAYFSKIGRKYGLLKEFRENGII